jgi:hypothetical protein
LESTAIDLEEVRRSNGAFDRRDGRAARRSKHSGRLLGRCDLDGDGATMCQTREQALRAVERED